jgi:sterol desaturase/sphingolipid hydroxylase (fatty acid hydroxylase superfamily)
MIEISQSVIRVIFFFGVLLVMMFFEWRFPRRQLKCSCKIRWTNNLALVFIDTILLRVVVPILAIGIAIIAEQKKWGVFNLFAGYYWFKVIISVIILDFIIYLQHVMFHKFSLFWRMHRMHHTDLDIDVTTGLRFHPLEIILSMIIKMIAVIIFGIPVFGVLVFEILLNATSMFNHSNVFIPLKLDKYLRCFIVTPDMHRVHHSIYRQETDSNYGFNLPWWDRICGTYKAQPRDGHINMQIGLKIFRDVKFLKVWWLLLIPFIKA